MARVTGARRATGPFKSIPPIDAEYSSRKKSPTYVLSSAIELPSAEPLSAPNVLNSVSTAHHDEWSVHFGV